MKTIYKYKIEVEDMQTIILPKNAQILTVQMQNGNPYIWALIDNDEEETEAVTIGVYGTGNPIDNNYTLSYIGTFQMYDSKLVFHVFRMS
ncbi:MAG: hypothetical protein LKK08_06190 [Bacteroidales bacterium]|jgi:hypothetical protein|nr:hypothetical protein [Bacteroidales bacterium]